VFSSLEPFSLVQLRGCSIIQLNGQSISSQEPQALCLATGLSTCKDHTMNTTEAIRAAGGTDYAEGGIVFYSEAQFLAAAALVRPMAGEGIVDLLRRAEKFLSTPSLDDDDDAAALRADLTAALAATPQADRRYHDDEIPGADVPAQAVQQEVPSYWMVEKTINGQPMWWDGGHSGSFVADPQKAIHFCRREDAYWARRPMQGAIITEHTDLPAASQPQAPAAGGDPHEQLLRDVSTQLSRMFSGCREHVQGDAVVGYTVRTGALHTIVGLLGGAGYPVAIPANLPQAHETITGILTHISDPEPSPAGAVPVAWQKAIIRAEEDGDTIIGWEPCTKLEYQHLRLPKRALCVLPDSTSMGYMEAAAAPPAVLDAAADPQAEAFKRAVDGPRPGGASG
jgi:hypothetical protein